MKEFNIRIWPFNEISILDQKLSTLLDIECLSGHAVYPDLRKYLANIDVLVRIMAACGVQRHRLDLHS